MEWRIWARPTVGWRTGRYANHYSTEIDLGVVACPDLGVIAVRASPDTQSSKLSRAVGCPHPTADCLMDNAVGWGHLTAQIDDSCSLAVRFGDLTAIGDIPNKMCP